MDSNEIEEKPKIGIAKAMSKLRYWLWSQNDCDLALIASFTRGSTGASTSRKAVMT